MAANPFDQFDVAQTAAPSVASPSSSNAFDQFDAQPVSAGKKNAFGHVPPKQSDLTALETLDDSKANAPLGKADTAMLIGKQIWDAAVYHAPAAFAASLEGDDPYGEKDWKDSLIDRSRERIKEGAKLGDKDTQTAIPFVSAQDAKSLGPSLGFSAVGAGAGFAAGIPAGIAGNVAAPVVGTAAGYAAGGAASGAAAYRMSTNQFVRDLYEAANDESVKATGKPITAEEFKAKQDKLAESIKEYGLWEAVPEAVGNVAGFGIIKAPIKGAIGKLFGENILKRFATKMGSLYGTEVATETVTQQGQHNVEIDAGLSKEPRREWTSPGDLADSFKEVAPSTILQTTLMAGGVKAGTKLYDKMRKAEAGQPADPTGPGSVPPGAVPAGAVPAGDVVGSDSTAAPEQAPVAPEAPTDLSMQNRDRTTAASVIQMQGIANAPDFDRLNAAPTPDSGAPMVSIKENAQEVIEPSDIGDESVVTLPDGSKIQARFAVVEADRILASHGADGSINQDYQQAKPGDIVALNNGRTAGLQESYRRGTATQPGGYMERLLSEAKRFGIDPAAVTGKNAPVLVRMYDDAVNARPDLAKQANSGGSARMSAMEVARNDAAILPDMANLVFDEAGDLNSPANQPFVRGFVMSLPAGEQAEVVDRAGNLSQVGATRIRNAIIAKAYGETSVFGRLVESMDDSMRNMAKSLVRAAPKVARMKELIAAGAARDMDIAPLLVKAVDELTKLRAANISLADFLAQADMFGKGVSGAELEVLAFLDGNLRSPNKILAFIDAYYLTLDGLGSPNQGDMFGAPEVSVGDLVSNSINSANNTEGSSNEPSGKPVGADSRGAEETGQPVTDAKADQGGEVAPAVPGADAANQGDAKQEGEPGGKPGADAAAVKEEPATKKESIKEKAKKAEAKAREKNDAPTSAQSDAAEKARSELEDDIKANQSGAETVVQSANRANEPANKTAKESIKKGDTITFSKDVDYATGGVPYTVESAGKTGIAIRNQKTGGGTSIAWYLLKDNYTISPAAGAKPAQSIKEKAIAAEAKIELPKSDKTPVKDWPLDRLKARLAEIENDPKAKSAIAFISGLIAEKSATEKPAEAPAKTEQKPERFAYPESSGNKEHDAIKNAVVDVLNGDMKREALIDMLAESSLPPGVLLSYTNRLGDRALSNAEQDEIIKRQEENAKKKAPESDADRGKAMMAEGLDELISMLGGKTNMLPEEEAKIIPIMSKIFRGAALIGYSKFSDAAKCVMDTLRSKAPDVAAKLDIDNLQAGYINAMKNIEGPSTKAEIIAFDSIDQLYEAGNDEKQKPNSNDSNIERTKADKPSERSAEDLPPGFLLRHRVTIDSYNKESGKMEKAEVSADEALKAANDDVAAFKSLLKCVGG